MDEFHNIMNSRIEEALIFFECVKVDDLDAKVECTGDFFTGTLVAVIEKDDKFVKEYEQEVFYQVRLTMN